MLRWGQSTVQRLGGGGSSSRHYTTSALLHRAQRNPRPSTKTKLTASPTPPALSLPENPEQQTNYLQPVCEQRTPRNTPRLHAPKDAARTARIDTNIIPPGKLALYRLRHWIADPDHRVEYTPEALYELYTAVKHRGHLSHLAPSHFSLLLHLFGVQTRADASLASSRRCHALLRPTSQAPDGYWHVVREIVRDMEDEGKPMNMHDLHWALLAHIPVVTSSATAQAQRAACKRVSTYYLKLRHLTPDSKAHLPFLTALESLGRPRDHDYLISHVCFLLETYHTLDQPLLDFVWRTILSQHAHTSTSSQARVVQAVRTRFHKFRLPTREAYSHKKARAPTIGLQLIRCAMLQALHAGDRAPLPFEAVQWAHEAISQLFAGTRTDCWHVLCVFVYSVAFDPHASCAALPPHTNSQDTLAVQWRIICLLDVLDRKMLRDGSSVDTDVLRGDLWSLWDTWEPTVLYPKANHHLLVVRAIVVVFLRLSAWTKDAELAERCLVFAKSRSLFYLPDITSQQMRTSVNELVVASLAARAAVSRVMTWDEVFAPLVDVPRDVLSDAVGAVIKNLVHRDISAVRALISHCRRSCIPVPPDALYAFGATLAVGSPQVAISVLPALKDAPQQAQLLLDILRALRRGRWETVQGGAASEMYAASRQLVFPLSESLRYDVRCCVTILISSGRPAQGMRLAQLIAERAPAWVTLPFCRLLVRLLIRSRQFKLATEVVGLFEHGQSAAKRTLGREIAAVLAQAKAARLARQVYERLGRGSDGTQLEDVIPETTLRYQVSSTSLSPGSGESLRGGRRRHQSTRIVIQGLLNAGRPSAARRVYGRSLGQLDARTRTALGNALIHRTFARRISGRHLIKAVLRARNALARSAMFIPDAATANMVLKAVLRWRALPSERLRAMFDHVARAMLGWRTAVFDVGEEEAEAGTWAVLEPLSRATSFARHVRPMMKMFVKAFHLRGDQEAARVVWRLLKVEEDVDRTRRRVRAVARVAGTRRRVGRCRSFTPRSSTNSQCSG
ncbi:hypothetical protein BD626DRAFT_429559 [Schizophyllum amplum]|uniref:Uncharacterized protein n=1 Tax=Schizophyllum amplum TaxID=97359 RepID=A0A550CJS0_9AGAR|nr:hypothetical protein BD626DRAFT_429559 [Auriculariopsis ampla]